MCCTCKCKLYWELDHISCVDYWFLGLWYWEGEIDFLGAKAPLGLARVTNWLIDWLIKWQKVWKCASPPCVFVWKYCASPSWVFFIPLYFCSSVPTYWTFVCLSQPIELCSSVPTYWIFVRLSPPIADRQRTVTHIFVLLYVCPLKILYILLGTCYLILVTQYLLLDICYMLLVTWYLLLDNCYWMLVTGYLFLDTCYLILDTWYLILDMW